MQFLRGEKKEKLNKLVKGGKVGISFLDYDWSANDCNSLEFDEGALLEKSFFFHRRSVAPPHEQQLVRVHA